MTSVNTTDQESTVARNDLVGVEFETVSRIIRILEPLSDDGRRHALNTVATWFRLAPPTSQAIPNPVAGSSHRIGGAIGSAGDEKFSGRQEISPKEFIFEKDPVTDVERMACLAYYLTHFRDVPHFKTIDLSKLNVEAAQRKFSNPAFAAQNAMRDGFFVAAPKGGYRQLSAMGERYVQALPDRNAAAELRERFAVRRARKGHSQADDNHEE